MSPLGPDFWPRRQGCAPAQERKAEAQGRIEVRRLHKHEGFEPRLRVAEWNARPMKVDAYSEMYLWNRNVDGLIRVLQRLAPLSIHPKQGMKAYAVWLEEIRAGLNADFAEAMATRERADEGRHRARRMA